MNPSVKLTEVLYNRKITVERDRQFLREFQQAVLLDLRERGVLTETQFRYAAGQLQRSDHVRR